MDRNKEIDLTGSGTVVLGGGAPLIKEKVFKERDILELHFDVASNDRSDLFISYDKHNKIFYVTSSNEVSDYCYVDFSYSIANYFTNFTDTHSISNSISSKVENGILVISIILNQFITIE